jgi:hypothetical protein
MVNSNSLTTIKTFPLNKRIQRILPVIEIYTIDDTLFVYTVKIDEPVEVTYSPEEPNVTFRQLREALVASEKFTEAEIDEFIDYFNRLWMKLEETDYADFQRCFARPTSIEPLNSEKVFEN